jgi:hypothetical protein
VLRGPSSGSQEMTFTLSRDLTLPGDSSYLVAYERF